MAFPILLTAAALGGGWLVLAKKRAEIPGAVAGDPNTPVAAGDPVAGSGQEPKKAPAFNLDGTSTTTVITGGGGDHRNAAIDNMVAGILSTTPVPIGSDGTEGVVDNNAPLVKLQSTLEGGFQTIGNRIDRQPSLGGADPSCQSSGETTAPAVGPSEQTAVQPSRVVDFSQIRYGTSHGLTKRQASDAVNELVRKTGMVI